jgi:hypothetical protein
MMKWALLTLRDYDARRSNVARLFEIALPCSTVVAGRPIPLTVRLITLHQSLTYAGLVEGVPTDRLNRRLIDSAVRDAKEVFGHAEPFLFRPEQTPFDIGRKYPFGEPATIPAVRCIAYFECLFPTPKGQDADYSCMTMVWFQDEFAMPIDPDVLNKIRAVDWLELATNSWR